MFRVHYLCQLSGLWHSEGRLRHFLAMRDKWVNLETLILENSRVSGVSLWIKEDNILIIMCYSDLFTW